MCRKKIEIWQINEKKLNFKQDLQCLFHKTEMGYYFSNYRNNFHSQVYWPDFTEEIFHYGKTILADVRNIHASVNSITACVRTLTF